MQLLITNSEQVILINLIIFLELAYNFELLVASILISFFKGTCPCCLEMKHIVRVLHYLRVPGSLGPCAPMCKSWCCAKVHHVCHQGSTR